MTEITLAFIAFIVVLAILYIFVQITKDTKKEQIRSEKVSRRHRDFQTKQRRESYRQQEIRKSAESNIKKRNVHDRS